MEKHTRAVGDRIKAKRGSTLPPKLLSPFIGQEGIVTIVSSCIAVVCFDDGTELALYADEMEDVE